MKLLDCRESNGLVEVLSGDGSGLRIGCNPMTSAGKNRCGQPICHMPIVKKCGGYLLVTVGQEEHAMNEGHHIEWIAIEYENVVQRVSLSAGRKPEAVFRLERDVEAIAYTYCSLHGLWRSY